MAASHENAPGLNAPASRLPQARRYRKRSRGAPQYAALHNGFNSNLAVHDEIPADLHRAASYLCLNNECRDYRGHAVDVARCLPCMESDPTVAELFRPALTASLATSSGSLCSETGLFC